MCCVFSLHRSGYYAWLNRKPGKRAQENEVLDKKIIKLFDFHKKRYGAPRITGDLHDEGAVCSKNRVARRMNHLNLQAKASRKYKVTTNSNHHHQIAPNLLRRGVYKNGVGSGHIRSITRSHSRYPGASQSRFCYEEHICADFEIYSRNVTFS